MLREILSKIPVYEHSILGSLLEGCTDAERKLRLFDAYHKAAIRTDARLEREKTKDEGAPGKQTDAQKENQRLNQRRNAILSTTDAEIDEEMKFLFDRKKEGTALLVQEVDDLSQRKEHEHRIEMKYNVNLTNGVQQGDKTQEAKKPTDHAAWKESELTQLDAGLSRLPIEHVRGNQQLSQICRTKLAKTWDKDKKEWADNPRVGGYADPSDHSVHVTDIGARGAPWRTEKTSELAHHKAEDRGGEQPLSLMEEVIAHELGHNAHQQDPKLFQKYQNAAGWERLDKATLKARLMAPVPVGNGLAEAKADEKLNGLEGNRKEHYGRRGSIDFSGKEYRVDPYSNGYLGLQQGSIPRGQNWDYARSNPEDHFAEHYTKAIHAPESLYKDLKADPEQSLIAAQRNLDSLKVPNSGASAEDIAAAEKDLAQARHDKLAREKQWSIVREDVFQLKQPDVDAKVASFTAKLLGDKISLGEEFRQKAAMCMTPQQLRDLEAEYNAKL